jgi:hypothetical protein
MKGKDGQLGITGEGLLLENAKGKPWLYSEFYSLE